MSLFAALALLAGAAAFRTPPNDELVQRIMQGVQRFYGAALPEKAYLHLDKAWYTAGETIWLKAYVVDARQHRPDTLSKVLHVDLLNANNQVVARRNLLLDAGLAPGDIALPDTLTPGNYTLRAYTGWMRNAGPDFFFSRRVAVWPAAPVDAPDSKPGAVRARAAAAFRAAAAVAAPPDVQFFPEGGNLIAGLENTVAFKATNHNAHGLDMQGQVFDAENHLVASFRSSHLGMGTFTFTPVPGQRYHAVVAPAAVPMTVALPAVQQAGYLLHVVTLPNDFLVAIQKQGGGAGPVLLVGQVRGTVAYVARSQMAGTETFAMHISKSKFPGGIVHFTLFDGQGNPLAERLAFAQTQSALRVTLTPERASYRARQPVRVRVSVADATGQPVAANLSLAITDSEGAGAGPEDIASHLLLTSDLAGYVENPNYYFQNPTPETAQHLDALLLTQGWRRFVWKAVLAGQAPVRDYGVERSLGISGQVTQPNGKPVPNSKLTFLESWPTKQVLTAVGNPGGYFLFAGFGGCDTTRVTLQARAKDARPVVLHLDAGPPVAARPLPPLPLQAPVALAEALSRSQQQRATERKFRLDTTRSILLGGVTVRGAKAQPVDSRRLHSPDDATVVNMAALPKSNLTVLDYLRGRVAGVSVSGDIRNPSVIIRGGSTITGNASPLFLLDGAPVGFQDIANYQASEVESIEVLKGPQAAIYGSQAANGVIGVYTRRGSPAYKPSSESAPGVVVLNMPGYHCGREFYVPRYDSPHTNREFPDTRRATLYWNPSVRTDAAGQAEVTFFTSDAKGGFQLQAEGLSGAGQPAQGRGSLRVE
ncbi:TonB-dependent receptor plug domain-containing protein [Hymenobacter sp. BT770]|uniref:TonB-dependent receptor plug domain-containing protein n=1 Tax=Hymenobacter sp. BT770 TaxID=2886942 RepID=UPI001D11764F|nr:TonB-dependent receptor plug domain-containing protein [Hymenobacter sp. BT770]MCC3153256.1 TonB-dependent receptor plug domain-containing protein [Hymenobacter sp. BT770]MDO3414251.1 TonB-dependent receptor plug domain-containing protein [Hymenobacter sp. BT770]